jgi:SAM-dependent methyltransferase
MKSEIIKRYYDSTYDEYRSDVPRRFEGYERNEVLARIYDKGEGRTLLDIGAGNGTVSRFFLGRGYDVHAVEWTDAGQERLQSLQIKVLKKDIEDVPLDYEDGFFDEVFWGDNVEHLFFPEVVAKEILRILKPGGRLVLSTPNHGWIVNRLYYLMAGVPRRTEGHRVPIWQWQHIRYFNARELARFLAHCGFGKPIIHGAEWRWPFSALSRLAPTLFGSVLVAEARK